MPNPAFPDTSAPRPTVRYIGFGSILDWNKGATDVSVLPRPHLSRSQSNSGIANSWGTDSGTDPDHETDNAFSAALNGSQIKAIGFAGEYLLQRVSPSRTERVIL
jgi:hypothetical protein